MTPRSPLEAVAEALATVGRTEPAAPGRWRLWLDGRAEQVQVRLEGVWLIFHRPNALGFEASDWTLLEASRDLEGPGKFVADADSRGVRADVPTTPADRPGAYAWAVRAAVDGVEQALHGVGIGAGERPGSPTGRGPASRRLALDEVAALCETAGWIGVTQTDHGLRCDLRTSREPRHATIRSTRSSLRFEATLLDREVAPEGRRALATLLMHAAGALRLARAFASDRDGHVEAALAVDLPHAVPAHALGCALGALATGCDLVGPELTMMAADGRVARRYLERQAAARAPAARTEPESTR